MHAKFVTLVEIIQYKKFQIAMLGMTHGFRNRLILIYINNIVSSFEVSNTV